MVVKTLTISAAVAALMLSSSAFAQSQPGVGAPASQSGAPTAPNGSVAPSMAPQWKPTLARRGVP